MQPGQLGNGVSNDGDIMRMIQDLQRQVRELAAANPFATMGLTPLPNALQVDGELDVKGPLSVDGTATFGGTTTIGGNAAITGTLSLPAGIINNAALSTPIKYDASYNDSGALNVTTTEATVCSMTFTVPSGFTTALVLAFASVGVVNPLSAEASIAGRVYVDAPSGSTFGPRRFQGVQPNTDGAVFPLKQQTLSGLTGGNTITCRLGILNTGPNWGATSGGASLNGFVLYTR